MGKGERNVIASGDITNSAVISGDHNVVQIAGHSPAILSSTERQSKLIEYRQRVMSENCFVNLRGIPLPRMHSGRPLQLQVPLEKVYIRLQATEEQPSRIQEETERQHIEKQIRKPGDTVPAL